MQRIAGFLMGAAVLLGLLYYSQWRHGPITSSGTIEADEIRIGSLVGGRVDRVLVAEGDAVSAGTLLVELDAFDLRERRAEAEANLAVAEAELARLEAGFRPEEIAQAKAMVEQLTARLNLLKAGPRQQEIKAGEARLEASVAELQLAQQNFDRTKQVYLLGASTQEKMDTATEQLNAAQASNMVRTQELDLLRAGTREEELAEAAARLDEAKQVLALREAGYRTEEVAQGRATVAAAKAALAALDRQLTETKVVAPTEGVVEALDLRPGDLVSPRAPVMSMMDTRRLWIRTYVPINKHDLQVGQRVPVIVDSFPDERFEGIVAFISRDPEFTPSNAQTPEDRAKQVFRVKVMLGDRQSRLRPGMSGVIVLEE